MKIKYFLVGLLCLCQLTNFAQDKEKAKIKFGKVSPEDFKQTVYSIDSNANAVIIGDIGATEIVGNNKGWFSLEYKRYKRVHILNKNGYDAADVQIGLYTSGSAEEELTSLKAVTYNLENGKVVETRLEKENIFKDKISKRWLVKKFTFPNIKAGSIIEFEYKVHSDFIFNLQPWEFQGNYPHLWSEYNVSIPQFYYYMTMAQGYHPFYIKSQDTRLGTYSIVDNAGAGQSDFITINSNITDYRWVMKDVPALKEESYTSTINNHISKIQFQLSEYRPPLAYKNLMASWPEATRDLMNDADFGATLNRDNGWLSDVVKEATVGAATKLDKAKSIFAFVRDNFTCTKSSGISLEKPLKAVLKARNGTVAEINLLLTAMLLKANIEADPVLLSTRSHGFVMAMYPLLERYNYVISHVSIDGVDYYLDASEPRMGFNKRTYETYNGSARLINPVASSVNFLADSLLETSVTSVFLNNDDKGNLTGSVNRVPGYFESFRIRNRVKEKGQDDIFTDIKKNYTGNFKVYETGIDSLTKLEEPVKVHFYLDMKNDNEDIIYMNPMFGEGWKDNPFKSAERKYPVEMPYAIDEVFILTLDVPKGYVVDELPKQTKVKLYEDDDTGFEYLVSVSEGVISLRSRVRISRATYHPDEYELLREFFNLIVKKHSEQIVFKKKS
ncbi:MAG: hypothetical protein JWQ27_3122 [Ferruginibacter sp.]|nr:hypothetical protein [Ferruginibacter sp.]